MGKVAGWSINEYLETVNNTATLVLGVEALVNECGGIF